MGFVKLPPLIFCFEVGEFFKNSAAGGAGGAEVFADGDDYVVGFAGEKFVEFGLVVGEGDGAF